MRFPCPPGQDRSAGAAAGRPSGDRMAASCCTLAKDDLMSVAIASGQVSAASQPTRLFHLPSPEYAVADHGKRFLIAEPISQEHPDNQAAPELGSIRSMNGQGASH